MILATLLAVLTYVPLDMSSLSADRAITGKNVANTPPAYTTSGRDRSAIHVFDGSGLSADKTTHTASANGTMFMSEAQSEDGKNRTLPIYLQVDLGEAKRLGRVTLFNFNMAGYTERGVKDFDLYVSDGDAWETSVDGITANYTQVLTGSLAQAAGTDGQTGETFDFEAPVEGRFVALVIKSEHIDKGGLIEYAGLSEMILYTCEGEPEEPTGPDAVGTDILVEAESFATKGGWVVDPQFVEQMGSPYLLAHGRGIPCADATTKVVFPSAGRVRAWVRTRDWTPDWDGEKPGQFRLAVGSKVFPNILGVAPANWGWVDAGVISMVSNGEKPIYLKDLTGFEGRCDAIYFTPASVTTPPPNDPQELAAWRAAKRGEAEPPVDVVEADLVVVGGGIAGTAAAIAAADAGLSVAIVQDRPMLGGNASDEIRVRTEKEGHEFHWIMKAIWNTQHNANSMAADDSRRAAVVAEYPSITPHLLWRSYGVVTNAARKILAVDARHVETGARRRFVAPLYVDTTGDGWIGYWAGARYMLGREAKDKFDEPQFGQDVADTSTMGNSLLWTTKTQSTPYEFPSVPWATKVSGSRADTSGGWQWEAGLDPSEDTIEDAEMLRDRLFRAIYGSFSNMKAIAGNETRVFNFFGHIAGKRESRRLVGDYIVRENDVTQTRPFEDAIGIATWTIDLHRPSGTSGFQAETTHNKVDPWWMPYRSLYSADVPNLFMAGRCASYSHVAFGSSRVMHAGGQQGVAVGYAAALCKRHACLPREIYRRKAYTEELRALINSRQTEKGMSEYVWPRMVMLKETASVVVDNDDATGVEISGDWAVSTSSSNRVGANYLHSRQVADENLWVRYTPELPGDGDYRVSLWWNGNESRGATVPIEIVYDGGTTNVLCNMTANPEKWFDLGSWPFKAGAGHAVRILTTGQEGKFVIADAVKFARFEEVRVPTARGGVVTVR